VLHGGFAEVSKKFRYKSKNIYENNYIGHSASITSKVIKSFDILLTSLSVLYKYSEDSTKLFADLYLAKFLNASVKPFSQGV